MIDVGRTGVWLNPSHAPDPAAVPDAAAELEALGYGTFWIGGSPAHDLGLPAAALDATRTLTVATGVATIWDGPADALAARYRELAGRHPDRFLLGLGASHAALAPAYAKPFSAMVDYLDGLDAAGVPAAARVLAALGPKMLALSATRAIGSHPYLVTPEHTRQAREILGAGPLLAPEQKVVLSTDPAEARAVGRARLAGYLALPNYLASLRRLGFGDDDVADGGSDRLVDALVAWGDADAIAARVAEHRAAGADHVALQVLTAHGGLPLAEWRALAPAVR
ncbi:MAG TPA: LLM class F420-dependent oxidoreductase [Actinocatenispora sp.]